jgi:hypothetical protein
MTGENEADGAQERGEYASVEVVCHFESPSHGIMEAR